MFKKIILSVAAVSLLVMTSCSSKLGALSADNFNVDPNPMVAQAGNVPVTINGTFPQKYMKKKAVVTVTPELRASDGSVLRGAAQTFQGEKVVGNDQTISYQVGGNYTMRSEFPYSDTYHKSELYLTFDAKVGKKAVEVPAVKVADGIISTSELYRKAISQKGGCIAVDSFQRITQERQSANIKFLINQAQLRKSELKSDDVQSFVKMIKTVNDEQSLNLKNVEIQSYASPEGGMKFNEKLASKRLSNSEKYLNDQMKKMNVSADVDGNYTAEDWEGFQELVAASNIQDKDVILRVLSMYQDPEEREQQIRNMSAGFRELADGVLPELRRSRMIINYETVGRSDDEIKQQYKDDASKLSADELLYCASLDGYSDTEREAIYKKAAELYPTDSRALNNVASMELKQGNTSAADKYLDKALAANSKSAEAMANKALVALENGNLTSAQQYLSQATGANDYNYAMGAYNLAKGNYQAAAENLKGQNNNLAALAQVLNNDYDSARSTFKQIGDNGDATTDYLHAIMSARQGNSYAANTYLKDAVAKDSSLSNYASDDLEFSNVK